MCLGALVHAGVPLTYIEEQLSRLGIQHEFRLRSEAVLRNQQLATKVHVDLTHTHTHEHNSHSDYARGRHTHEHPHAHDHHHTARKLPEIEALIQQAQLPKRAASWSLAVFRRLAEAEAAVHGIPPAQVHFHEVGATDAIVDIVGTCVGLDWLEIDELVCSPLPTGGGTVRCEHGLLPVPVPAVLSMMTSASIPVYSNGIEKELVTPTGCAIAATLAHSFGPPPRLTLQTVGLGAGGRNLALPNILRLWLGTVETQSHPNHAHQVKASSPHKTEAIIELQTQLDDISPQAIAYTFNQLFTVGAVEVFTQAIAMKKNRLGTLLTVLCPQKAAADCETLIFQETTTLGIRRTVQQRSILDRKIVMVNTDYGEIPVKVASCEGKTINVQPEFEDCARVARSHNIPFQQVHRHALSAAKDLS